MGLTPDVGGTRGLGRPPNLNYTEQEQSANTEHLKQVFAQVPNTIDVPLTKVGGDIMKYESHSGMPKLARNVNIFSGMTRADPQLKNPQEQKKFEELEEKLPFGLSIGLKRSLELPWEERDPVFILLEKILRFAAKSTTWIDITSEIQSDAFAGSISRYAQHPDKMLEGWCDLALEIRAELRLIAKHEGLLSQLKQDCIENIKVLNRLLNFARAIIKAKKPEKEKLVKKFNKEITFLLSEISTGKLTHPFAMTFSLLENALALGRFFSLEKASPTLLGVDAALAYLFAREPTFVDLGEETQKLGEQLFPDEMEDPALQHFLPKIAALGGLLMTTLTLSAPGIYELKVRDDPRFEEKTVQCLALRLSGTLFSSADIEEIFMKCIFPILGETRVKAHVKSLVQFLTLQPLLLIAGMGEIGNAMLKGWKKSFSRSLKQLKEVEKELRVSKKGLVSLQHGLMAVKKESSKAYWKALEDLIRKQVDFSKFRDEWKAYRLTVQGLIKGFLESEGQQKVMDFRQVSA